MEFSRQEYWSGLPFPSPGDFPDPGIEPESPGLQADCSPYEPSGEPNRYWRYLIKFNCPSSLKKYMNSWIKYSHLSPKASTMPFSGNLEGFSKQEHEKNDCNDLLFNINLQFVSRGSSGLSELPRCPLCPWSLPSPQAGTIHIYSFLSLIILPSPSHSSLRITSWFAETEASGLSETSSHPCLRLLCPPTTDKHRRCIKSQALYLCTRSHFISPPDLVPAILPISYIISLPFAIRSSHQPNATIPSKTNKQTNKLDSAFANSKHPTPLLLLQQNSQQPCSAPPHQNCSCWLPMASTLTNQISGFLLDLWASRTHLTPSPWLICISWLSIDQ